MSASRRRSGVLLATTLTCLLALSGCTSLQGSGDKGYVTGDGSVQLVDAAERDQPVSLSGDDLDGKPMDLADFRGTPTVIVVWGSWCVDCRVEAPDLVDAADRLDGTARFVGIDIRDPSTAQAQTYVRTFDVPYPSFYAPDGQALLKFSGTLTPSTVPATVVLDGDGRIAASIIGRIPSTTTLVDVVEDVAAEDAAGGSSDSGDTDG